tara:strand:+ start:6496 stop:6636 length:141 start_codon:yes stop_codon:yes gene_type:complete
VTTEQIIEEISKLLSKLADKGFVDESWEIQAVVDREFSDEEVSDGR